MATSNTNAAENTLQKVRNEIALTKEWKDVHKTLSHEVNKSIKEEAVTEKTFDRIKDCLHNSQDYKLLEQKAMKTIQQHFFSSSLLTRPKPNMQLIDKASAMLIENRPQFKSHLKAYVNLPLPRHLRKAAWNAFLRDEKIKQDFYDTHKDFKSVSKADHKPEMVEKSKNILQLNALSEVRRIPDFHYMMSVIVKHWTKTTSNEVSDTALFLCIPFLYCCSQAAEPTDSGSSLSWSVLSEVAEMYFKFMDLMPTNMRSMLHNPKNASSATLLCKQVETLLSSSDFKLVTHLKKVLKAKRTNTEEDDEFHKLLLHLVHPYYQKMFIGACTIEFACFVMDQCLIFTEIPNSKFMPYCITTWMLLNRKKILSCHDSESVKNVLRTNSLNLSVEDFRKEIDARFISDMKEGVDITSVDHAEEDQVTVRVESPSPVVDHHRESRGIPASKNYEGSHKESNEKDIKLLKQQVAELLKSQTEQSREYQDQLIKEKEAHRKEIEELRKEMESVKENNKRVSSLKGTSQSHHHSSARGHVTSPRDHVTRISVRSPIRVQTVGTQSLNQRTASPGHRKKYKADSLSPSDVRELNEIIMGKFREAMYLVCHGTDEEKEKLQAILKKSRK